MIDIRTLQRLSRVGDRLEFVLSDAEAYKFSKLAKYPLTPDELRRDHRCPLFNVHAELFNPYFSTRFWQHCLRVGAQLPPAFLESLSLDLVSVPSEALGMPVRHLVSAWRHQGHTRVAGAQFISDLSYLVATQATAEQKALLVRRTIGALIPAHYDVVAVGFELPPGMKQAAAMIEKHEPWQGAGHFEVFRAGDDDIATLKGQSLTARLFLSATGSDVVECFVVELRRYFPGVVKFVVFVFSSHEARPHVGSSEFWSCALTPLVADSLRTFELHGLPGQKSRVAERRKVAQGAAMAALAPMPVAQV